MQENWDLDTSLEQKTNCGYKIREKFLESGTRADFNDDALLIYLPK